MENSDEYYIEKYLKGDKKSLENLIKQNIDKVYSFVFHIVSDVSLAEDITQETFVKVWKNLKKYEKQKKFKPWLYSIAHNTTIDWLRKKKNIVFSDFENDEGNNFLENTLVDSEPLADELFSLSENIEGLKKGLEHLPSSYREVLFLYYNQGMTFEEVGSVLKKSVNTVKSQHRRAVLRLKKEVHPN